MKPELQALIDAVEELLDAWYLPEESDPHGFYLVEPEEFTDLEKAFEAYRATLPPPAAPDWSAA